MNIKWSLVACCVCALPAYAFSDSGFTDGGGFDDTLDAATPDASVGQGGADMNSQENEDDMTPTTCTVSSDCGTGFECHLGKCNYSGFRPSTSSGCSTAMAPLLLPLAVPVALRVLRKRRRRD